MTLYDVLYKKAEQEDGKAIWMRCGIMIEKENGKKSLKLDAVPAGSTWDGWLVVSERKKADAADPRDPQDPQDTQDRQSQKDQDDSDIPF